MKSHSSLRTLGVAAAIAGVAFATGPLRAQTPTTFNFSILAGSGATLGSGTTPSSDRFFNPLGMAVDSSGNIYVADAGDHTVKEISGGNVTVIAGQSGTAGTQNFSTGATSARFIYPAAVAVDSGGNVYVADMGANAIFKISGGNVSVVAGSPGTAGSQNGAGTAAQFNGPEGIAVDGSGNVYVSDTNNSVIRKIDVHGNVTTLAGSVGVTGSSDGSSALFNYPGGIAFDATTGNLYVADYDNSTIRAVSTTTGSVSTFAGSAGVTGDTNGAATGGALFNHPAAVAVDGSGHVYVMDTSNQVVREIAGGAVTTVAGSVTGGHSAALFFYPQGIAVTASGSIYVSDTGNHEIKSVTGGVASILQGAMGTIGFTSSTFAYPYGITVASNGNIYVADSGNNAIRVVTSSGSVSTLAGTGVAGSADGAGSVATFNNPSDVAVDSAGNVYVADTGNSTIRMITPGGTVSTLSGIAGTTGSNNGAEASATYNHPQGIAIDASGNLYIADTGNSVIRMITKATGQVSTYAGTVGQTGTADNVRTQALFNGPTSVAVDSSGNVYVADFSNNTIRKISAAGNVTTLAGAPGVGGDADGSGTHALFNQPYQLAVDGSGNVYVADTYNHAVRVISTAGAVTTIGGDDSRFYYPQGVAVSSGGTLYVADGDNQSIDAGTAPSGGGSGGGTGAFISNHTVPVGGTATFTIGSAGAGDAVQWEVSTNGGSTWTPIAGATGATLTLSNVTSAMNGNEYTVLLNGAAQTGGTLYVGAARLINLSTLAGVSGTNTVSAGFYVSGNGTKNLVVRGIGPGLASEGVNNYLADPTLTLNTAAPAVISSDTTGWGGSSTIANDMSAVGAFSLSPTSLDEVLVPSLTISGSTGFSAVIGSKSGGSGEVLAEVYDMDTSGTPPTRLVNISTKAYVTNSGSNVLIAGFVITGSVPETVLIRGDGPSLSSYGVSNPMATPTITLYQGTTTLASNTGWANSNAVATAAAQVGAYALPANSADSAMVVSLNPGSYSVEVTGANGSTGTALLEIYEVQ